MSELLNQTVEVNITKETTTVERAAFNIPAFVASHTAFSPRTKEYASLSAVAADFSTTSNVYIAATAYFGQELKPPKIVIGRRQVNSVTGTISTVTVGAVYSLTVNGINVSYTALSGATQQSIIDGLEAAYAAATSTILPATTFLDNTGSFTISPTVAGVEWSIKASSNIALVQASATETWADTLTAVRASSDAFYGLNTEDHTDAAILAIAAWAQASNVLYGASTASATVPTASTTDIGSLLNAAGYDRTFLMYNAGADTTFPEAAWMGRKLPPVPGSAQWIHAQLVGPTPDKLTAAQIGYLEAKKVNYYVRISGRNVTKQGWVSDGTFIESTVLIDWTKSRIQERIFFRMVNSEKLPSDNPGLAVIQNDIYSVLYEGVNNGGFGKDPAPYCYVPDILEVDPNLRAQGIVDGIKFRVREVISINKVIINGTVYI
jgi:hypothetical protein